MRVLLLYRPRLPDLRAQNIAVVHASQALAARGHTVTVLADRGPGPRLSAEQALAEFALERPPSLDLRVAPLRSKGLAGLWFRHQLRRWAEGPPGVVIARDQVRLLAALPLLKKHRIVLEVHGLDSALARERGEDPDPLCALEAAALRASQAMFANCEGTMASWEEVHAELLPERRLVVHNATSASRSRGPHASPAQVIRCLGSLRGYKGASALLAAAPRLPLPLVWTGATAEELVGLGALPCNASVHGPAPYPAVPDLLADSAALLLPLSDNLFGRRLTSPLKLWDYLATATPILAPDLPTIHDIAARTGATMHFFRPGDAADLARAAREALAGPTRAPFLRTWDSRAAELEALLA